MLLWLVVLFKLSFLFLIYFLLELIYNIVLILAVQQSDLVVHIYTYILHSPCLHLSKCLHCFPRKLGVIMGFSLSFTF